LSRLSPQAISGVFVLVAGAAVVYTLVAGPVDEPVPVPPVTSRPEPQVVEVPLPTVEGIDDAVQRVLYASGKAEAMAVDQLSQLPPEVARILVYYGVTLAIPTEPGVTG
jgi:hypothetical protein